MCARVEIGAPSVLRLIRRAEGCGLGEDVADLRFELGVKAGRRTR